MTWLNVDLSLLKKTNSFFDSRLRTIFTLDDNAGNGLRWIMSNLEGVFESNSIKFDQVWSWSIKFDQVWSYVFNYVWFYLIMFDQVQRRSIKFNYVLSSSIMFDQVQSNLVKFNHFYHLQFSVTQFVQLCLSLFKFST